MKVKILPYSTEDGIFWKVIWNETGDVIDNGFESTADAEMYCYDEKLDLINYDENNF